MSKWLIALFAAVVVQLVFFVWALVPDGDAEGVYLVHGWLAVTGQIGLYGEGMTGHRMPLPYYVLGLSQVLWGPSLLAARSVSAALGFGSLILVWWITRRLGGSVAGILALAFAATNAYLLGHFAWATFHALITFLLLVGVAILVTDWRWRRVLAMGVATLLFFTRPLVWPVLPLALGYLVWTSERRLERWLIVLIALGPPAVFILADVDHLKLLTMIPGLDALVRPLGFEPVAIPYRVKSDGWFKAVELFGRSYKSWIVATVILLWAVPALPRMVRLVVWLTLSLAASQFLMVTFSPKAAVGYFPSFALLMAIPLGYGFAVVPKTKTRWVVACLSLVFLLTPILSPPPMLPRAVAWDRPAMVGLNEAARELQIIPQGSRVFLFGPPEALFMAGLRPYVQQANHLETLSPLHDAWTRQQSGQWGDSEIRAWLGHEVPWAIVRLDLLRKARPHQSTASGNNVDLIEALLRRHFAQVAVLPYPSGPPLYVYRRL